MRTMDRDIGPGWLSYLEEGAFYASFSATVPGIIYVPFPADSSLNFHVTRSLIFVYTTSALVRLDFLIAPYFFL